MLFGAVAVVLAGTLVAPAASADSPPIVGGPAYPYYHDGGLRGTKGFGQVEPRARASRRERGSRRQAAQVPRTRET
ncbi:MAG: hypothetical protein JO130_12840 [Solirubrobacterales bacterium]|nr:hypothetical protein [Solirubrobacterales bacterium]